MEVERGDVGVVMEGRGKRVCFKMVGVEYLDKYRWLRKGDEVDPCC